ncbi:MAG: alpha/beta hydrolase [Candidatus Thorarchaeota archaeon]|jgi:pimeloyl-ACP methyl ester carboxylesterase
MAVDRRVHYYVLFILTILIASSLYLSWTTESGLGDLDVERTGVEVEPGRSVNFTVYSPRVPTYTDFMPVILTIHGVGGSKESMYAFNVELARRNFTVVSVDLAGHGDSDVLFEWNNYDRLADDCYAALQYVWGHYANTAPGVYGVIGHSLGWHVGLAMYNQPTQPGALVAVGPVWIETATFIPTNTLLASGQFDELIPAGELLTEFQTITGNVSAEAGTTYGNLTEGTAYRLILAGSNHITEVTDRLIVIESATWMIQALQGEDQLSHTLKFWRPFFRTYDLVYRNRAVAYSVGAFTLLASLIPLLFILAEHLPKQIAPKPIAREAAQLKRSHAALISIALGGLMVALYSVTGNMSQSLGDPGLPWVNSYNALGLTVFFLLWPVVLFLFLMLTLKGGSVVQLLSGIGFETRNPVALVKAFARAIIPALIGILWLIIWMSFGGMPYSHEPIIILPILRIPIDQRLMGILALALFALPFSIADSIWSELLLQDKQWDSLSKQAKGMTVAFVFRLVPMSVFALVLVLGSAFLGFVAGPSVVLGLLLLYFVIATTAATFILFFTSIKFKNPWPAIFINALLYAWILVNAMPLV